jgi:hypothetical protein
MAMNNLKTYNDVTIRYDYIISLPSGLVIDMKHSDIITLFGMKLIKMNLKTYKFACTDEDIDKIYGFLNRKVDDFNRSEIISFLQECGLLRDQF